MIFVRNARYRVVFQDNLKHWAHILQCFGITIFSISKKKMNMNIKMLESFTNENTLLIRNRSGSIWHISFHLEVFGNTSHNSFNITVLSGLFYSKSLQVFFYFQRFIRFVRRKLKLLLFLNTFTIRCPLQHGSFSWLIS